MQLTFIRKHLLEVFKMAASAARQAASISLGDALDRLARLREGTTGQRIEEDQNCQTNQSNGPGEDAHG